MDRSFFRLFVNVLLVVVLVIASIPSLNINLFGKQINFDAWDFSDNCLIKEVNEQTGQENNQYCIPKFSFTSTRAFENQNIYSFEFKGINENLNLTPEQREEAFQKDYDTFVRRVELLELNDYVIKKVVGDDNNYYVEISVPRDYDGNYMSSFATLAAMGEFPIYEDIPNYTKPETTDEQTFDFLAGKRVSEFLSLRDAVRISKPVFDGNIGAYVLKVDFGNENKDKVMQSAQGTYTVTDDVFFPGITIVYGGMPMGLQALPIPPVSQGYDGQSYVIFYVLGESANELRIKTLYSLITTDPINTEIVLKDTYTTTGIVDRNQIEYTKFAIPLGLILLAVFAFIKFGKSGLIWASNLFIIFLFSVGFSQLGIVQVPLGEGLILGSLWGIAFGGLLTYDVINWNSQNYLTKFEALRKSFWVIGPAIVVGIISIAIVVKSVIILNVAYSMLIFLISTLYLIEGWMHAAYPYIFSKSK